MRTTLYILAVAGCATVLHLLLGWAATGLAAIVAVWAPRRVLVGAVGVGLGWLLWVAYSLLFYEAATVELLQFLSAATGDLPPAVLAFIPGLVGALWGTGATLIFSAARDAWHQRKTLS